MTVNLGRVALVTVAASIAVLPGTAALTLVLTDPTPRIIVIDPSGTVDTPAHRPPPTLGA